MTKILIIGGGVSGLSAGIYARLAGFDALLCEQGRTLGGNLTGWRRGDYEIDNCIHWLTGTNPASQSYGMWRELGALDGAAIFLGDALYSSEMDGKVLSLSRDLGKTARDLLALSPEDEKEILRLVRAVDTLQRLSGIGGRDHNEKIGRGEAILRLPALARYYRMTTGDLAARFHHPLIRAFLTDLLTEDFGSIALLEVMAHYCGDNGGVPEGASLGMAKRMEKRFLSLGGTALLGKKAVRIGRRENGGVSVSFADGDEIAADFVVTTAEPTQVFSRLLGQNVPPDLLRRYESRKTARFSAFHFAFACPVDALPFRGDRVLDLSPEETRRIGAKRLVAREFSHEKAFAPEGETVLQTMALCGEAAARGFIALRRDRAAYRAKKEALARAETEILERRFPSLAGNIRLLDGWTPATYRRYVGSEIGSFMGFAFSSRVLPLSAKNRVKGWKNVILAGQWLRAPGGLPIAAESGRRAVSVIARLCGKSPAF